MKTTKGIVSATNRPIATETHTKKRPRSRQQGYPELQAAVALPASTRRVSSQEGYVAESSDNSGSAQRQGAAGAGTQVHRDWRKSSITTFIFAAVILGGIMQTATSNYKVTTAFVAGILFTVGMRWSSRHEHAN